MKRGDVECCEGEEGQMGCELTCQRTLCPLYIKAIDMLYAHHVVLEEARRLSSEGE